MVLYSHSDDTGGHLWPSSLHHLPYNCGCTSASVSVLGTRDDGLSCPCVTIACILPSELHTKWMHNQAAAGSRRGTRKERTTTTQTTNEKEEKKKIIQNLNIKRHNKNGKRERNIDWHWWWAVGSIRTCEWWCSAASWKCLPLSNWCGAAAEYEFCLYSVFFLHSVRRCAWWCSVFRCCCGFIMYNNQAHMCDVESPGAAAQNIHIVWHILRVLHTGTHTYSLWV